jgi:hypothetical protein
MYANPKECEPPALMNFRKSESTHDMNHGRLNIWKRRLWYTSVEFYTASTTHLGNKIEKWNCIKIVN